MGRLDVGDESSAACLDDGAGATEDNGNFPDARPGIAAAPE
jgi:hypothetical protein